MSKWAKHAYPGYKYTAVQHMIQVPTYDDEGNELEQLRWDTGKIILIDDEGKVARRFSDEGALWRWYNKTSPGRVRGLTQPSRERVA